MTKQEILKTHFGYDTFREGQEAVIDALLAEKDVLAVMLSGTGPDDEGNHPGDLAADLTYERSGAEPEPGRNFSGIPKQLPDTGTVFYSFALRKSRTLPYYLCGT